MKSELKKAVKKLELMKALGSDPKKVFDEGKKYSCEQCARYTYTQVKCLIPKEIAFKYWIIKDHKYCFFIWTCWRAKK